jgi:hypothetical protein
MGDALFHSEASAKRFGGVPEDYLPIHKFLDQSKLYIGDWRHRALLHNTLGVTLCEQFFGDFYARPSDGEKVCTRTIATQHILEDLGALLTPGEFLREMPVRSWMNGLTQREKHYLQSMRLPPRPDEPTRDPKAEAGQGK